MESKYSPEKDREQDPDCKNSAFTSIGSIADYTKNTECLKFQLFCLFSTALWTPIFTFVYWEVLCKQVSWTKEHFHPSQLRKEWTSGSHLLQISAQRRVIQGIIFWKGSMLCYGHCGATRTSWSSSPSCLQSAPSLYLPDVIIPQGRRWDFPVLNIMKFLLVHFSSLCQGWSGWQLFHLMQQLLSLVLCLLRTYLRVCSDTLPIIHEGVQ